MGPCVSDYLRCRRRLKAVTARATWNIILKQVLIAGKRDPYPYLERYLNSNEIDEVLQLPARSRRQVDRIIEIVDEYGACDDELRETAYEAFGVTSNWSHAACTRDGAALQSHAAIGLR